MRYEKFTLFTVVLELRAPGGVAAPEQLGDHVRVHAPLARDPAGAPYVPAGSLAGSLRAHLGDRATVLMGSDPGEKDEDTELTPSPLWFCGTRVVPSGDSQVRTRTAVDRQRGAADTGLLYTSEHLPPGSTVTAYLRLNKPELYDELVDALRSWTPYIGGGRTTGHGRAVVTGLRHRTIDLGTPEGRRAWLTEGGPAMFPDDGVGEIAVGRPVEPPVLLELPWRIADGLHIGTGESRRPEGEEREIWEVLLDHRGRPYVPGSTWKGVLRARCEFLLRSLDLDASIPTAGRPCETCAICTPIVKCARRTCVICTAFGYVTDGDADEAGHGRRGALIFDDAPITDATVGRRTHVALDRVFGGARPQNLYTDEVVESGTLTLRVRTDTGVPDELPLIRAVLTLACLDLHHGLIGIGGATTRGMGTLRLQRADRELRDEAVGILTAHLADHDTPHTPEEVAG